MIETKLKNIMAAEGAIQRLLEQRMNATAAYRLSRFLKLFQSEIRGFHEHRNQMIMKLGVEEPAGSRQFSVKDPGRLQELAEALNKLGEETVKIDRDPLPLAMLDGVQISAGDMLAMEEIIVEA